MVGAKTLTKIIQMFGISRGTVLKVMIAFKKKTASAAQVWPKVEVVLEGPSDFTRNC